MGKDFKRMNKVINSKNKISKKKTLKSNDIIDLDLICDTWKREVEKETIANI